MNVVHGDMTLASLDAWWFRAQLLLHQASGCSPARRTKMKALVVGSTGGSGRAAVMSLLEAGHRVTAFSRKGELAASHPRLQAFRGDALSAEDMERAVRGHDAVIVTLGITENPFRVRLFGPAYTPIDIRSRGTRNVIAAMKKHGVRRLVAQTTYGVGVTRDRLGWIDRVFFELLLKPQIADTEVQNRDVTESGLDWSIVQPVHLTDAADDTMPFWSASGETERMKLSRRSVGRFLAGCVDDPALIGMSIALSGAVVKRELRQHALEPRSAA
jgi:hypothetical protein